MFNIIMFLNENYPHHFFASTVGLSSAISRLQEKKLADQNAPLQNHRSSTGLQLG